MKIKSSNAFYIRVSRALPVVFTLLAFLAGTSAAVGQLPNSAGLDGFLVAMIQGTVIDPADMTRDGNIFFQDMLGMTPAETDAFEAEAVAFFKQRFGIDAYDPRLAVARLVTNTELGYRIYHLAGYKVPPEGWELIDGAVTATVIDPDGITLGGDFEGVHVPAGSLFPYGYYLIHPEPSAEDRLAPSAEPVEPLLIHFRGWEPAMPGPTGTMTIRCELISDVLGNGMAQGIFVAEPVGDGNVRVTVRNVMTLSKN